MKLALAKDMRDIDRRAADAGLPGIVLMENAGYAVAERAVSLLGSAAGKKVCVFAGRGNNGGDAFVTARYLLNQGIKTRVFVLADRVSISPDAAVFLGVLESMRTTVEFAREDSRFWDSVSVHLAFSDLIIDGMLGTGFHGALTGLYRQAVGAINNSRRPVLAIDLPSGVDADTGMVEDCAVRAGHTVTLGLPKPGLFVFPGKEHAGEVSIAPIGLPYNIIAGQSIEQSIIMPELVSFLLPRRSPLAHKHQSRAGVIAGAPASSGAAALCAEAALRAGAGVVRLFAPDSVAGILSIKLTEVMVECLPDAGGAGLDSAAADILLEKADDYAALAIGPGLGTKTGTAEAICRLLSATDRQLVLDADALNILAANKEILANIKQPPVLTPHMGEMTRLTGLTAEELRSEGIINVTRRFAKEWRAIIVLKGMPTLVGLPYGQVFVSIRGNPGLATAGSGDVLTGVIAGLAAQGLDLPEAAVCGVYLHGLAADLLAADGMYGLAAGDLIAALPKAWSTVMGQGSGR